MHTLNSTWEFERGYGVTDWRGSTVWDGVVRSNLWWDDVWVKTWKHMNIQESVLHTDNSKCKSHEAGMSAVCKDHQGPRLLEHGEQGEEFGSCFVNKGF